MNLAKANSKKGISFGDMAWVADAARFVVLILICIGVTLFTCLLEFLQLWNPEPQNRLNEPRVGRDA